MRRSARCASSAASCAGPHGRGRACARRGGGAAAAARRWVAKAFGANPPAPRLGHFEAHELLRCSMLRQLLPGPVRTVWFPAILAAAASSGLRVQLAPAASAGCGASHAAMMTRQGALLRRRFHPRTPSSGGCGPRLPPWAGLQPPLRGSADVAGFWVQARLSEGPSLLGNSTWMRTDFFFNDISL